MNEIRSLPKALYEKAPKISDVIVVPEASSVLKYQKQNMKALITTITTTTAATRRTGVGGNCASGFLPYGETMVDMYVHIQIHILYTSADCLECVCACVCMYLVHRCALKNPRNSHNKTAAITATATKSITKVKKTSSGIKSNGNNNNDNAKLTTTKRVNKSNKPSFFC